MRKHILMVTVAALFLVAFVSPFMVSPLMAQQQQEVTLQEFQAAMMSHIEMLQNPDLLKKFQNMKPEEWQAMYDNFPNKRAFVDAVNRLKKASAGGQRTP